MNDNLKRELKRASKELKRAEAKKIEWEKVLICGVALGWMISTLYLLLVLTAFITK